MKRPDFHPSSDHRCQRKIGFSFPATPEHPLPGFRSVRHTPGSVTQLPRRAVTFGDQASDRPRGAAPRAPVTADGALPLPGSVQEAAAKETGRGRATAPPRVYVRTGVRTLGIHRGQHPLPRWTLRNILQYLLFLQSQYLISSGLLELRPHSWARQGMRAQGWQERTLPCVVSLSSGTEEALGNPGVPPPSPFSASLGSRHSAL